MAAEIDLDATDRASQLAELTAAINRAEQADRMTYVIRGGRPVAAIVPFGVAVAADPEAVPEPARAPG